jgi:hypothetical protein
VQLRKHLYREDYIIMAARTRVFGFILYPESVPADWQEILRSIHVPVVVSPLHDADFEDDGTPKKAHWHCTINFDGPTSLKIALEALEALSVTHVEPIRHVRTYNRYMCHLDDEDKAQYNPDDVQLFNGARFCITPELTKDDRQKILSEIQEFVIDYSITEFCDLADYALQNRLDWFEVINTSATIYLRAYITSKRHKYAGQRKSDDVD